MTATRPPPTRSSCSTAATRTSSSSATSSRVTGNVGENQGQTQISVTAANVVECGTGTVAPTDVTLPMASATAFERYEGMLVRMAQTLTVTEHFQLGRFGEVLLSSGGRLQQPTNVVEPGAPAIALQAQNDLNQILVDDASQAQNPDPIVFGRGGQPLSAEQHPARWRHHDRPGRRHDLHLGWRHGQPERLPGAAAQRPRRQHRLHRRQPAARRSPRTSAVTCASSA